MIADILASLTGIEEQGLREIAKSFLPPMLIVAFLMFERDRKQFCSVKETKPPG